MRIANLAFAVVASLLLSACGTFEGVGKDIKDFGNWSSGRPSAMERSFGRVPTGYAGHNKRGVLKPHDLRKDEQPQENLEWNDAGAYQAPAPEQPVGVAYGDNVTVYPVDGQPQDQGLAPIGSYDPSYAPAAEADYGRMVQEIYFLHASAHLTPAERKQLREVAGGIARTPEASAVTVVGHASKRVDGVSDPIQRKMINFDMAQKRAMAVTQALNDAGVRPGLVQSISRGEDAPNANPGGRSQEAADRRVEVFVR